MRARAQRCWQLAGTFCNKTIIAELHNYARALEEQAEMLEQSNGAHGVWIMFPCRVAIMNSDKTPRFDPEEFLSKIGEGRTIFQYHKKQDVFAQGELADSVFYIQKGKVKLTVVSEHGKEAVVAILGKDEFCGEGCLAEQKRRVATAAAMTECEIMRLEKRAIIRALQDEPTFSAFFVEHLLERRIRVEEDLVDQLFNSSEKRLARALLLLANFGKDGTPEPVIIEVSQETLAEMIGTTRSRVSFFMNKFRKLGFISYKGKIEVHSSLLDVVLHDHPQIGKRTDGSPGQ